MGFEKELGNLRKFCRAIVLPTKKIQKVITEKIPLKNVSVIDMGSGTLFWSNFFAEHAQDVYAVDTIYPKNEQNIGKRQNIHKFINIEELSSNKRERERETLFWACDVLHHLDFEFEEKLLKECATKYRYIAIKDINKHKKIGNFMNKLHDRFFNHEIAHDVDPIALKQFLQKNGFDVEYFEIRRLWYPHFLIIATKIE